MQTKKRLIQTRNPYSDKGIHDIHARGSYRQSDITEKGSLHIKGALQTRDPYRQGGLIDKEFIQTKGLYSK